MGISKKNSTYNTKIKRVFNIVFDKKRGNNMDYSLNSIEECFQILEKVKYMCNEENNIEVFDTALYKISQEGDMGVIERLCTTVLNDEIEEPLSAMHDILETIFYISEKYDQMEQGIYIFLSNGYKIIKNAPFGFKVFSMKILNTYSSDKYYISAIKRLDKENLKILLNTLYDIEKDDKEGYYKEHIDFIIKSIK